MENQLTTWIELFRSGKKLRVNISFSYKEISGHALTNHRGKSGKRGSNSATRRMLAERDALLDAEQDSMGQPSVWRYVYDLMRCTGPPCHLGPHCWRDPVGKKHYRLKTHHLKGLVRYVEQVVSYVVMETFLTLSGINCMQKSSNMWRDSRRIIVTNLHRTPQPILQMFSLHSLHKLLTQQNWEIRQALHLH